MKSGQKPDVSRVRAEQSILVTKGKRILGYWGTGMPGILRIPGHWDTPGYRGYWGAWDWQPAFALRVSGVAIRLRRIGG